jgi:hypothetical protein
VPTVGEKPAMDHIPVGKNCQSIKIFRIPRDASGLQKTASHGPVSRDVIAPMGAAAASIVGSHLAIADENKCGDPVGSALPSPLRGGVGGWGPQMQADMIETHQR